VAVVVAAAIVAVAIAGSAPPTPQPVEKSVSTVKRGQPLVRTSPPASPRAEAEAPKKGDREHKSEPKATPTAEPDVAPQPVKTSPTLDQTVHEATSALPAVPDLTKDPVGTVTDTVDEVVDTGKNALPPPVADALP
jgi:hypothetical protein